MAKKSSIAKKASKWARTLSPPPSRRNSRSSSIERSSSEKTRKRKKSRSKSRDEPLADTRLSSRTERQQHRHSFSSTNDEPTRSRTCRSSLPTLSSKRTFETDAWKDEYADEYSMARGRVSSRDVPRPPGQQHVIVFVHGFQGTKYDMHLFRNQLQSLYPDTACLLSSSNQQKNSEGDIRDMGKRLAKEILDFIGLYCGNRVDRLSFVCHSLGGIIIRQALACPALEPFLDKLYSFVSLAVCHVGYLYNPNRLINLGFWALMRGKKSLALKQLGMSDEKNPRDTLLYTLSQEKGLQYFRHVMLVSSPEDRIAPYHSTRIEIHQDFAKDETWGDIYREMVDNLISPLTTTKLSRVSVSFANSGKNFQNMIGHTAHLCFLDNHTYMQMLLCKHPDLWR